MGGRIPRHLSSLLALLAVVQDSLRRTRLIHCSFWEALCVVYLWYVGFGSVVGVCDCEYVVCDWRRCARTMSDRFSGP
jgi:hypothetical protein